MKSNGALEGRRIIVTGAASGMGRAVAELFIEEGASLALFDLNASGMTDLQSARVATFEVDVSVEEAVSDAVRKAGAVMGGIDGVVNAAGLCLALPFAETDPASWRKLQDVNLLGPYLVIRAALEDLNRAPWATIVNFASVGALRPSPGLSAYAAAKGGLVAFTRGIALELAPTIRANALCPGIIHTPMTERLWDGDLEVGMAAVNAKVAMKRFGAPLDVANVALFLSSEASAFVTGATITVDGGHSYH